MRIIKKGFTLIEVALFLAVTGLLFLGVTVGVQNSIFQQRYNDSVQNFMEFLRGVYSEVTNVQNLSGGRSEKAIYGKLVTFGQKYKQDGETEIDSNNNTVFTYSVVGKIGETSSRSVLQSLSDLDADVAFFETNESGAGKLVPAGIVQSYTPKWAASIQFAENFEPFVGAILVVRNPSSGMVYTYVAEGETLEINQLIHSANTSIIGDGDYNILKNSGFLNVSHEPHFEKKAINFCINPNGNEEGGVRRNVRLISGARNASGVELIPDEESVCVR
ncbi:MAG: hypothetical protein IKG26_06985 [Bacillus sp. (in: Bacteria)]|nr:hypothetical protein [Bacillus sp. (in: firmicutes)]